MISYLVERMIGWLYRPFPFPESSFERLLRAFLVGMGVAFFLTLLIQFSVVQELNTLSVFIYSILAALVVVVSESLIHLLFSCINWSIIANIISALSQVLITLFLNLGINLLFFSGGYSVEDPMRLAIITLCVAFPIVTFITWLSERRIDKKIRQKVMLLRTAFLRGGHTIRLKELTIDSFEKNTSPLCITNTNFLYAAAEGNYVHIFYQDECRSDVKSILLRMSLKHFLQQTEDSGIIQCHRSFAVQIANVLEVSGNARGYQLTLCSLERKIPLSRGFSDRVLSNIELIKS